MNKLLSLVVAECANYSEKGPFGRRHYCCGEPRQTDCHCLIANGIPCRRFKERVLPLRPELQPEWQEFLRKADPGHSELLGEVVVLKRCACGRSFKPRSNRQTRCPACSKKNAQRLGRERSRAYRAKKAA